MSIKSRCIECGAVSQDGVLNHALTCATMSMTPQIGTGKILSAYRLDVSEGQRVLLKADASEGSTLTNLHISQKHQYMPNMTIGVVEETDASAQASRGAKGAVSEPLTDNVPQNEYVQLREELLKAAIRKKLYNVANFYTYHDFKLDGTDYEGIDRNLEEIMFLIRRHDAAILDELSKKN